MPTSSLSTACPVTTSRNGQSRGLASLSWVLLLVVFAGWLASELRSEVTPTSAASASYWRRTADGWEDRRTWAMPARVWHPPLHPAVVVSLQIGGALSLLALGSRRPTARIR